MCILEVKVERAEVKVAEFVPVDFEPKTGEERKSFDLYKKARIVDPNDVYDSTVKLPWYEFDTKGKEKLFQKQICRHYKYLSKFVRLKLPQDSVNRQEFPII